MKTLELTESQHATLETLVTTYMRNYREQLTMDLREELTYLPKAADIEDVHALVQNFKQMEDDALALMALIK